MNFASRMGRSVRVGEHAKGASGAVRMPERGKGGETLVWDDFPVFLALARNPSLRVAADALGLDPTTVSRRLMRLSKALDTTLFERHGGYHYLTERGVQLLETVEKAEAAIISGLDLSESGELSGLIKIAAPEAFSVWFLGPHLEKFQGINPNVEVALVTPTWAADPQKREVDVAILTERPARGPLTARKLAESRLHLYASEAYLESHAPIRSVEDIAGHRYFSYLRSMRSNIQALDDIVEPLPGLKPCIRTTSMALQMNMVSDGKGIALLPSYAGDRLANCRPVLPDEVSIPQEFWLVVRQDVRHNSRVSAFIKWLLKTVAENRAFFNSTQ